MDYYNLSRDYAKLYALVSTGLTIVGFVKYHESTLRDVVKITSRKIPSSGYIIGCRGIEYNGTHEDDQGEFESVCRQCDLEWIEANWNPPIEAAL